MPQYFGQAHDRQLTAVVPGMESLGLHQRPADTGELRFRKALPQFGNQARTQAVSRSFAGDKCDAHERQRSRPRVLASMKANIWRTSSESAALCASSSFASASVLPETYTER